MSAAKHTPGPWTRDRYGHVVGPDGQDVRFRSLTIAASGTRERLAIAEANTDLATAAPEALALLQRYVDMDLATDKDRGNDLMQSSGLHRESVALLAKATGAAA